MASLLIYGYGNPGRADDGLGILFSEQMQEWADRINFDLETDSNYQLTIEDAERISHFDVVLFADASTENIDSFELTEIQASDSKVEFTMHAVSAAFVLDLCEKLYGVSPKSWLLHLKGHKWELGAPVSNKAKAHLRKSLEFVQEKLLSSEF